MPALEWIKEHDLILALLGGSGVILFVASLIAIPFIVAWMPADYFIRITRKPIQTRPLRQILHVFKNILGSLMVLSGLILLLLPGQGILTLLIGLSLIDFPGKHQLQLRLVRIPSVSHSIQWIRSKVHHQPLIIP